MKNVGRTGLTLIWQPPESDGGSPITGYIVERSRGTSSRWLRVNKDLLKYPQIEVDDLVEGNDYCFRVRAENNAGVGPTAETNPILAKTPYGKIYITVTVRVVLKSR